MKSTRLPLWIAGGWWLVAVLVLLSSGIAQAQEIEGTWRLVMRKLPDGKTQVPPAILGAYTAHNGLQNLNVFWRTPEGKPASFSRISTYKMSRTDFTETLLFTAMNDGSGKPTTYNLTGSTESTPVTREGGRLAFKLPFDEPSVVFEGDKFTATAPPPTAAQTARDLGGEFVDYWERVR